jgi:hypothetical protein
VVLASKPVSCETLTTSSKFADDAHNVTLTVSISSGPDDKFWPGERIGVPAQLEGLPEVKGTYVASQRLTASLEAFDARPGAHVKGWVDFAHAEASGSGTFDVTLCHPPAGSSPTPALAGDVPPGPVAGTMAGDTLSPKKAFAIVSHDKESDADHISSIEWFAQDDVSCDDMRVKIRQRLPAFAVFDPGGSSQKQDYSGTQQPARAIFRPSTRNPKLPPLDGNGWVKLDRLVFEEGKALTGSVRGAYASGAVAGTFSAQICRQ